MNTKSNKYLSLILGVMLSLPVFVSGGNEDRTGQAGAGELLINPYPRSSGWGLSNGSNVRGFEAMYMNVAGTAFTQKTEIMFANTQWLKGTGVSINAFGFSQKLGESSVLSLGVMSMGFGDIQITTVDLPEGGIGNFTPSLFNIGLSYAKSFSNAIYGGITVKIISESISDIKAQGVAIDAGIQYLTGPDDNIHFGIALRNIGPPMMFQGDGLSFRGSVINSDNILTVEQRSAKYELPTLLNIAAAYDIALTEDKVHMMTIAGAFTSNAFSKDQFSAGIEYNFKNYLMLRGGYLYEKGIFNSTDRTTAYTGPSAGISVQVPLNKEKGSNFSIDYSYRHSDPFQGTHCIGVKLSL